MKRLLTLLLSFLVFSSPVLSCADEKEEEISSGYHSQDSDDLLDEVLEEMIQDELKQQNPSLSPPAFSGLPFAAAPSPFLTSFLPKVSAKDMSWIEKTIKDGSILQDHVHQQFHTPNAPPSEAFLGLSATQRRGATAATQILQAMMVPVAQEKEAEIPPLFKRSNSPLKNEDASCRKTYKGIVSGLRECYAAQERLGRSEVDLEDLLPALGAYGVDGVVFVSDLLDKATFGAFGKLSEILDEGAQLIRTNMRRGVRSLTGSALIGQEVGDYTYVLLSTVGGKGLKSLKAIKSLKIAKCVTFRDGKLIQESLLKTINPKSAYEPNVMKKVLEANNPSKKVTSSTLPDSGSRGKKYAGERHPETKIVYDERGLPNFVEHAKYDMQLPPYEFFPNHGSGTTLDQLRGKHMRAATRQLREDLQSGKVSKSLFTPEQLEAIQSGRDKIPKLTWHHDPRAGRMLLVDAEQHRKTPHIGSISLKAEGEVK